MGMITPNMKPQEMLISVLLLLGLLAIVGIGCGIKEAIKRHKDKHH